MKGKSVSVFRAQFGIIKDLSELGHFEEAFFINRVIGKKYGVPTLYSFQSVEESFADHLAYFIVDSDFKNYVDSQVIGFLWMSTIDGE